MEIVFPPGNLCKIEKWLMLYRSWFCEIVQMRGIVNVFDVFATVSCYVNRARSGDSLFLLSRKVESTWKRRIREMELNGGQTVAFPWQGCLDSTRLFAETNAAYC
jgi:hypothetical protein